METILEARRVSKGFGQGSSHLNVLDDVRLEVKEGEFLAIVGFSGSGKSTLVNLLAGLLTPDSGEILFRGRKNPEAGPERGLVFQNYSLLPWMSVYDNVRLAVDQVFGRESEADRDARVRKYVEMVSLTPALTKKPGQLSGGMRQRVSLARTLAMSPALLLLDEPLGALDALTRAVLQDEIARIRETEKTTVVLITNDVDEGLLLADRMIALTPGPNATLGQEFIIDLPRPRERTAVNHDAQFKALRNDVLSYLTLVRNRSRRTSKLSLPPPPTLVPLDLRY
jgi:nitrate/nitrite transport system ATP-binding protein